MIYRPCNIFMDNSGQAELAGKYIKDILIEFPADPTISVAVPDISVTITAAELSPNAIKMTLDVTLTGFVNTGNQLLDIAVGLTPGITNYVSESFGGVRIKLIVIPPQEVVTIADVSLLPEVLYIVDTATRVDNIIKLSVNSPVELSVDGDTVLLSLGRSTGTLNTSGASAQGTLKYINGVPPSDLGGISILSANSAITVSVGYPEVVQ